MLGKSNASQQTGKDAGPMVPFARSVPHPKRFRTAALVEGIHLIALFFTAAALVSFFIEPSMEASYIFIIGMAASAVSWLIAFLMRRRVHCPLCKGTPLLNGGAATHVKARRLAPFNHGVSATLGILTTRKFRCMYCGSDYDLLKPRSRGNRKD